MDLILWNYEQKVFILINGVLHFCSMSGNISITWADTSLLYHAKNKKSSEEFKVCSHFHYQVSSPMEFIFFC